MWDAWGRARTPRAFSLIELLIVIAIIAILAAVLLPALAKSKESSRTTLCVNHMHQLAVASMVYNSDNTRLPSMLEWLYPRAGVIAPLPFTPPGLDLTKGELYPYVQSKAVYLCPSETSSNASGPINHSYQIPCMVCHAHDAANCLAPSRSVYFLEVTNQSRGFMYGLAVPGSPYMAFRHGKRENFVFMDTHTERLNAKQYSAAAADQLFWYPTSATGMEGKP